MEKKLFLVYNPKKLFLQIGKNYSELSLRRFSSFCVCGKTAVVYLVTEDDDVVGLVLEGGYVDRIKFSVAGDYLQIMVEVYTLRAGANPRLISKEFSYKFVDVL